MVNSAAVGPRGGFVFFQPVAPAAGIALEAMAAITQLFT